MKKEVFYNETLAYMIRQFTDSVVGSGYALAIDRALRALRSREAEAIPLSMAEAAAFAAIVIAQVENENKED